MHHGMLIYTLYTDWEDDMGRLTENLLLISLPAIVRITIGEGRLRCM
jgi:hypothetical protein